MKDLEQLKADTIQYIKDWQPPVEDVVEDQPKEETDGTEETEDEKVIEVEQEVITEIETPSVTPNYLVCQQRCYIPIKTTKYVKDPSGFVAGLRSGDKDAEAYVCRCIDALNKRLKRRYRTVEFIPFEGRNAVYVTHRDSRYKPLEIRVGYVSGVHDSLQPPKEPSFIVLFITKLQKLSSK